MHTSPARIYLWYILPQPFSPGPRLTRDFLDYANLWHSALSGEDHRQKEPKFFCLYQDFYKDLMANNSQFIMKEISKRLSRNTFWKLRYLFIPIKFTPIGQSTLHAALCVISPEAKTVDYICSDGDR
jgi:hypothetical protein